MAGIAARGGRRGSAGLVAGLAVLLALGPGEALAGRRGADVRVTLLDGGRVNGELIAVRAGEIIVTSAIIETTVAVGDIDSIVVLKGVDRSTLSRQLGVYVGLAFGFVAASAYARWYYGRYDGLAIWAYPIGIGGGAMLGEAAGGWLSGKEGKDKLYVIKGQPPETVAKIMAKLKRKARLRVAY